MWVWKQGRRGGDKFIHGNCREDGDDETRNPVHSRRIMSSFVTRIWAATESKTVLAASDERQEQTQECPCCCNCISIDSCEDHWLHACMHSTAAAAGNQTHPMHPSTPIDLSFFFFFLPASIHATTKELLLIITGRKKITRQKLSFDLIGVHELYRPVMFALQIVAVFVFPEVVQRINAVAPGSQRPEFAAVAAALYYCKHPPPPCSTIFFC